MIAYGDREQHLPSRVAFAQLREVLDGAGAGRAGDVAVGIACGELVQALLDDAHARHGEDELTGLTELGAQLCLQAGRSPCPRVQVRALVDALEACADAPTLTLREPEGYAFYALYPELYVAAARALAISGSAVQVIGIRSIGTSLAGFVAAALETERLPFSVRPTGHPFARTLRVGARLAHALVGAFPTSRTTYVVVDEGPGLSGSSFAAVARWLQERGVAAAQIVFLPSHDGAPGGEASDEARARYCASRRSFVAFEQHFDHAERARWFAPVTGPIERVRDLSGGRWRALRDAYLADPPPSHRRHERRKYLLERDGAAWLMKFVGLGQGGRAIAARARVLSEQGFTPAFEADAHGFALWRWRGDAQPLTSARYDRAAFVAHLGRYLAFLARRFPRSEPGAGATPSALLALCKHNGAMLHGARFGEAIEARFAPLVAQLSPSPVAVDAKLDAHEWLVAPDGTFLKCDAEGHHADHDCIGCQDPAWDVAGATLELSLDEAERAQLIAALREGAGARISPEALTFYEAAYAAFRAGHAHYAEAALRGWADDDAARFASLRARHAATLAARLR